MGVKPDRGAKPKKKAAPKRNALDDVPEDPSPAKAKRAKPSAEAPAAEAPKRATEASTKLVAALGVGGAIVLAVILSVLSARHYKRWDVTRGGLFTLSPASLETLHGLREPVKLILLMGDSDPMRAPVDETLIAYLAETDKLVVEYADPDKRPAEFLAIQKQYDLGSVDASMIVVHDDRHFFVSPRDLVAFDQGDDMQASPRIEQAITGAIRNVFDKTRTVACVTQGHGEPELEAAGDTGLAYLKDRLGKNNFEVVPVFGDPAGAADHVSDHLHDCNFLIVAGPTERVPKEHAKEIERFIEKGGDALLVAGPIPADQNQGYIDVGLGGVFALAGVKLNDNFILERDAEARMATGYGDVFFTQMQAHPVTASLARADLHVAVNVTGSLGDLHNDTTPMPLLKTTPKAIGVSDFFAWANTRENYTPTTKDAPGPLVIATASERAKVSPSDEHGARIVTIASLGSMFGVNWRETAFQGMAAFVESSITWASAHTAFLDIPSKPTMTMGLRLTEESLKSIRTYVFLLPVLASFAGIGAFLLRRRRPTKEEEPS